MYKTLAQLSDSWKEKGADLFLSEGVNKIDLSKIVIPKESRNQGLGTVFMQELCEYADTVRKVIVLTPSTEFGGSLTRLKRFYKKHGFVENKGRHKDFSFRDTFYRLPIKRNDPAVEYLQSILSSMMMEYEKEQCITYSNAPLYFEDMEQLIEMLEVQAWKDQAISILDGMKEEYTEREKITYENAPLYFESLELLLQELRKRGEGK